jgi:alkanesulfonate monooxygenase SsuD/methylene tetrahydromethanopterin reductase-like flavin-dependent oxidoreductase (luciferase family)
MLIQWPRLWNEVKETARAAGRDPNALTGAMYLTVIIDEDPSRANEGSTPISNNPLPLCAAGRLAMPVRTAAWQKRIAGAPWAGEADPPITVRILGRASEEF